MLLALCFIAGKFIAGYTSDSPIRPVQGCGCADDFHAYGH